jgi:predicted GIY-YIG superfamily endonuclease
MPREYDFWVYIMTNKLDTVLYIGMTNDLTRRVSEHQSGEIPGFTADYRCHKLVFLGTLFLHRRCDRTREAAEELVAEKESCVDREHEPSLG